MGTVPDLYQCPANDLDKYIFDYLQPSKTFQNQVNAAVDTICAFLKENCFRGHYSGIKVEEVVKGGSSAKGTALKTGSDADLVVYLNCIKSYDDQNKKRKEIIDEIRKKMEECQKQKQFEVIFEITKRDNPRVLSFRLRSEKVPEYIEFDVLPAYDALGQRYSKYLSKAETYADLIKNWSEEDNFSTCFTKLQVDFIVSRDTKLKSLIRLVKHWYKTKLSEKKKLPPKYALELLCIYAWENGSEGRERFNMAQAFRNVLALICNYQNLCVYWTKNYNFEDHIDVANFLEGQLCKQRPVILDPANPTGNLGEKCNWEQVAQEAKYCLNTMYFRGAASMVMSFKELPAMLLNVKLLTGATYALEVDPSLPISAIKDQVANKTGVPAYQQKLAFQNDEYVELKNTNRLSDYKLSPGDTVMLIVKEDAPFQVFLMTDKGRKSTYIITPSEGVTEFKRRIQQQERVQVSQFWLSYESKPLEEGRKLGEYNIVPEGTIYMNLRLRGG